MYILNSNCFFIRISCDFIPPIDISVIEVTLWLDEFEGGEAYQDDWTYEAEFKNVQEAQDYIYQNYGEVELLDTY